MVIIAYLNWREVLQLLRLTKRGCFGLLGNRVMRRYFGLLSAVVCASAPLVW